MLDHLFLPRRFLLLWSRSRLSGCAGQGAYAGHARLVKGRDCGCLSAICAWCTVVQSTCHHPSSGICSSASDAPKREIDDTDRSMIGRLTTRRGRRHAWQSKEPRRRSWAIGHQRWIRRRCAPRGRRDSKSGSLWNDVMRLSRVARLKLIFYLGPGRHHYRPTGAVAIGAAGSDTTSGTASSCSTLATAGSTASAMAAWPSAEGWTAPP